MANDWTVSRRAALRTTAAVGAVAAVGGCEKAISLVSGQLGQDVPATVAVPSGAAVDPAHHLLSRAAYGPWPGDVDEVRKIGEDAWIDSQLDPASIDDHVCDLRARRFETIHHSPGTCFEYKKPVLREEMARHTLLRAVYSKRQLFEVMVAFWTDHLNINIEKGDCIYLKPSDDREVIRKHALGKFRDLIRASATSAAMLVYLDGARNMRSTPDEVPNENYGRELLELHTLGVHGGYTQRDVYETARALTGWRVRDGFGRGTVTFDASKHDDGAKTILGQTIAAGGGKGDVDRVVDIVCHHPSTARHIATKLVRRFVSDDPPASLVDRVAGVFTVTGGDIKQMVRTILTSDEFRDVANRGTKFKPPFRFVASCLRAVGADTHAHAPLIEYLSRMGQGVFQHPTPDGYPDETAPWLGTLLWRWNVAYAVASNTLPSVTVPLAKLIDAVGAKRDAPDVLFRYLAGREPTAEQREALLATAGTLHAENDVPTELVGTILASPGFQMY
jgi:uncharacterized protein (DUF1800 family)